MLPEKPFYLIRHGETEANAASITAGGEFDSPLTENGRSQAGAVARLLHHLPEKPSRIIHSSMSRARDTANILNEKLQLDLHEEHELREHDVGEWSGQPWEDTMPLLLNDVKPKGGESRAEFSTRIRSTFTDILHAHDELLMLVAHGGVFHALAYMYGHKTEFYINNCHLHYFEPYSAHPDFPWRVWQFDIEEERLAKRSAPFCATQLLDKIA